MYESNNSSKVDFPQCLMGRKKKKNKFSYIVNSDQVTWHCVTCSIRSAAGTYIHVTWHIQQIAKRTMHVIIRHMSTGYCLVSYSSCCFAFLSILNPIYCTLTLCHSCVSNVLYARGVNTPVFCKSLCPISLCCWPFSLNKKSFVFN